MQIVSKACWYNNSQKIIVLLSKFIVLCLPSYFIVYFLKLELIFFYNRVVYYYTKIFLSLLMHPIYLRRNIYISVYRYHSNILKFTDYFIYWKFIKLRNQIIFSHWPRSQDSIIVNKEWKPVNLTKAKWIFENFRANIMKYDEI